jgi:hypothetical protein
LKIDFIKKLINDPPTDLRFMRNATTENRIEPLSEEVA